VELPWHYGTCCIRNGEQWTEQLSSFRVLIFFMEAQAKRLFVFDRDCCGDKGAVTVMRPLAVVPCATNDKGEQQSLYQSLRNRTALSALLTALPDALISSTRVEKYTLTFPADGSGGEDGTESLASTTKGRYFRAFSTRSAQNIPRRHIHS
jgi:hypothetical protein